MQLSIKHNFPDVQRRLQSLERSIAERALVSAVNRTLDQASVGMRREITAEFNVSTQFVRQRLNLKRATRGRALEISATLSGSGKNRGKRAANIIAFVERKVTLAEARRRAKAGTLEQLFVKVKRKGAAKPLKGAFIGNKGRTVFRRTGSKRLPIEPVQVIDIPQMFTTQRINSKVIRLINQRLPVNVDREVRFFTSRFNRGQS